MTSIPFTIVDAFCVPEKTISGNPAAVCLLTHDDDISDETKANIGAEFNLSQTAFISKTWSKSEVSRYHSDFTLRWFSPTNEVALCGHATLASSKVLFDKMERGVETETTIKFDTKFRGILSATMNWDTGRISIDLPLTPVAPITEKEMHYLPQLLEHLMHPFDTTFIHSVYYTPVTKYVLVRLHDELGNKGLSELKPDFYHLSVIKGNEMVIGVIVTVKGKMDPHFYSRFFAPWLGVNEDPVCGSAHSALTSYWSSELKLFKLLGEQCSKRSGYVYCSINESTPDRINLEGATKVFARGELLF